MKRLCTEGGDNSPDVVQTSPTEEVNATILQPLYGESISPCSFSCL